MQPVEQQRTEQWRSAGVPGAARGRDQLTSRAIIAALILLAVLSPVVFYVNVLANGYWYFSAGAPSVLQILLVLLLTAILGGPLLGRAGFTRGEILSIYAIVSVGAPLGHRAVLFFMLPQTMLYYHLARVNAHWETAFLQFIPSWWAPVQPNAMVGFIEGGARVPWALWWLPALAWCAFAFSLWLASFCLILLFQRQWIANERLSFPLAQIPLEVIRERRVGGQTGRACLRADAGFWLGAAIVFILNFLNNLHVYVPSVPAAPLGPWVFFLDPRVGYEFQRVEMMFDRWVLAIAYLIPKDVSFSCWFLWISRMVIAIIAGALGKSPTGSVEQAWLPAPYQGLGAICALIVWVVWGGRRHLIQAVRLAFSKKTSGPSNGSLYRWALLGLVASVIYMLCFCAASGCRLAVAFFFVGLLVAYFVFFARLRAEAGLAIITFPAEANWLMISALGSAAYRPQEIMTLVTMRWATFPVPDATLGVTVGHALEGLKIADAGRIDATRLARWIVAGFVLSLLLGAGILLTGFYHYGIFGTAAGADWPWPMYFLRSNGETIYNYLTSPGTPQLGRMASTVGVGAAIASALAFLRLRFWWWPLSPIGYVFATAVDLDELIPPLFAGWLLKVVAVRYGGLRLYRRTVPIAIGMIVGDFLNRAVWSFVTLIVRG